ncbi:MAG: S41 family peptidase [Fusobacteriaceae bacterium]
MKLWKKNLTLLSIILIFSVNCFSEEVKNNGFLGNIRELKEISDVMDILSANHVGDKTIDRKVMLQGALKGIVESLEDPHSNYFTKDNLKEFTEDIKGKYPGVGMIIQKKPSDVLSVVSPIEDTPAYRAGIKPRDKILSIDGVSTLTLTSDESSKKLKGEPGTKVKLSVYRESLKETKEVILTREVIKLKYVKSKMLANKIGYLRLTQFGENVYPDLAKELEALQKKGMKALVFDLRSNPGGSLDQAVKISSMFIGAGKIVSTKGKTKPEEISLREGKYFGGFPLVILINGGSASASEIVAGAIKDHKRGTLIGEKTFGKGSVQTLIALPDGDGIKLTIAKYYTPANISIHGIGIEPDIKVEEKENYLLFDGFVTNINEEAQKENKAKIIKEVIGNKEAKEFEEKIDIQLEKAMEVLSKKIGAPYTPKVEKVVIEKKKVVEKKKIK